MAVTSYGGANPDPITTASKQNQYAQLARQRPTDYATSFQVSQNNNQSNPYTSAWSTSAQQPQTQTQTQSPWSNPTSAARPPDNPNQSIQAAIPPGTIPTQSNTSPYQYQSRPYQAPSPWSPQVPATPTYTPYTPATTQAYGNPNDAAGTPWDPADFNTQALRDQYTAYMQATLPWRQFQQNNQQYSQDFNEAARRNDMTFLEQQRMNQYNMDLTGRQQTMAEWQQQEAARQWGEQFGWQQQNDLFSQGLANQQMGLDTQRLTGDQWYQQQQVQLAGQAQQIEQAYNEGRLSNEQRQLALAELTQQQNDAYRRLELAQQMGWAREQQANQLGFSREELQATTGYRQQQDELARWQMQQQMQMQQAELEAQRQNAILQATGRAAGMGPNANWQRRF